MKIDIEIETLKANEKRLGRLFLELLGKYTILQRFFCLQV